MRRHVAEVLDDPAWNQVSPSVRRGMLEHALDRAQKEIEECCSLVVPPR